MECKELKEMLVLTSNERHLENFASTIVQIGCLYKYNHDLDNAVYSFLQLKALSEVVGDARMKMQSLELLGQLMQDESEYSLAIVLLRRAIHYAWYLSDATAESDLYDKLGFLYFMQGDIDKAKYFHGRSIQHQTEDPLSENRQQSVYSISKHFDSPDACIHGLNQMVLAKLGLLTESESVLRFSTKISADLQILILREDKEFNLAMHDPSEINPETQKFTKIVPEGMESDREYAAIQRILDSKQSFQPIVNRNTQYKDPSTQKIVDPSMLKLPIEEKVRQLKLEVYDNERLQKKLKAAQVSALVNRSNKSQVFFYNHCSPNRSLLGFKYSFKPNILKMQAYFQKLETMIKNSESH